MVGSSVMRTRETCSLLPAQLPPLLPLPLSESCDQFKLHVHACMNMYTYIHVGRRSQLEVLHSSQVGVTCLVGQASQTNLLNQPAWRKNHLLFNPSQLRRELALPLEDSLMKEVNLRKMIYSASHLPARKSETMSIFC